MNADLLGMRWLLRQSMAEVAGVLDGSSASKSLSCPSLARDM